MKKFEEVEEYEARMKKLEKIKKVANILAKISGYIVAIEGE